MEKLKPCPFCGAEPNHDADDFVNGRAVQDYQVWVACENPRCGVWPSIRVHHSNYDTMVASWNRRADTSEAP